MPRMMSRPFEAETMVQSLFIFTPDLAKSVGLDENRFPENEHEGDVAEAALSKELEKLSLDEQEKIVFDVHGFSAVEEEDGVVVKSQLKRLENEINSIETKEAYERALSFNPSYVEDTSFRRMFLRMTMLDAKKAADMMVQHFEVKRELFGDGDVLGRDVRQSDLSPQALTILEHGYYQVLGTRDASGRSVWCSKPMYEFGTNEGLAVVEESNRAAWYLAMHFARENESQCEGVVLIEYNYDGWTMSIPVLQRMFAARSAIPLRVAAVHYCYTDPKLKPYVAGFLVFTENNIRARMRTHLGTPGEIAFKLQTFGIPTEQSPMQTDGTWSTTAIREWLATQLIREENEQSAEVISVPRRFDVLFGMKKSYREHTGNLRLLHLCEMNYEEYEAATKNRKADIAERLCSIIRESQGRFLKLGYSGWIEVEDEVARSKVAHFFRHMRSKKSKPTREARCSA